MQKILPSHPEIKYIGRVDTAAPDEPVFYWAGSSAELTFSGSSISAVVEAHRIYGRIFIGAIIDGVERRFEIESTDSDVRIELASGLSDGVHRLSLFKRQDGSCYHILKCFFIDDEAELLKTTLPRRRMEFFGDSVTAGAVSEAADFVGRQDPEGHDGIYDNAYRAYSMQTARNLGAIAHDTAQGGIALFDGTGYFHSPDCIGMETAFDKLCYYPEGRGGMSGWDFSRYTPHVVVIAIGQNDPHKEGCPDNDIYDPDYRSKWKDGYLRLLTTLLERYKKATFILTTTVLMHDPEWDSAIDEVIARLPAEPRVHRLRYRRNGAATPGHPRIPEHIEMAEELTAYISSLGDKIWED